MKRITSLLTAATVLGLAAFAQSAVAQTSAGAQPADPSTQPAPSAQQSMPSEQSATMPPSEPSNGVPPSDDSSTTSTTANGPDARPGTSSSAATSPSAEPNTRLAAITPPGMSTEEACTGFKSIRECAVALHAAQNLSIPFPDLKSKLSGGQKLGAAIHDLKPEANAKEEARRAEEQARSDAQARPQG